MMTTKYHTDMEALNKRMARGIQLRQLRACKDSGDMRMYWTLVEVYRAMSRLGYLRSKGLLNDSSN